MEGYLLTPSLPTTPEPKKTTPKVLSTKRTAAKSEVSTSASDSSNPPKRVPKSPPTPKPAPKRKRGRPAKLVQQTLFDQQQVTQMALLSTFATLCK